MNTKERLTQVTIVILAIVAILLLFALPNHVKSQNTWINELHYDNVGGDVNEFVEVVYDNPSGYDLSLFTVDFYNGRNGEIYKSIPLSDFIVEDTMNGYIFYYYMTSLQNGPDGIAIKYNGSIVDEICYEGVFPPLSTLIPVEEGGSTDVSASLQLQGDGQWEDMQWIDDEATPGYPNINQSLSPAPIDSFYLQTCGQWGHKYNYEHNSRIIDSYTWWSPLQTKYEPCLKYFKEVTNFEVKELKCILCGHLDTITFVSSLPNLIDIIWVKKYPCDTSSYIQWPQNYNIPDSIWQNWPNEQWYIDWINKNQ